jgi:predicted RND superfamily exporter protein
MHPMKYIVLMTVTGILLLQYSGAVPNSSVGGPITLALGFLSGAVAVGIHEAWTKKRGVLGWIVSILVALAGAFLAAELAEILLVLILMLVSLTGLPAVTGSLAATGGPVLYVSLAVMTLLMLLGSWGALQFVSRWR